MKTRIIFYLLIMALFVYAGSALAGTEGTYNTLYGTGAGTTITTPATSQLYDTFIGVNAGYSTTNAGLYNTFLGYEAGYTNTTADSNTFVGYRAGKANTSGYRNAFLGSQAGLNNTTGQFNTFLGNGAGYINSSGGYNVFIGDSSGANNTNSDNNVFIGQAAGSSNSTGAQNTFVGQSAGNANSTASFNTFIGREAGYTNTIGSENTFVGWRAGYTNVSGLWNTFVGYEAGNDSTGNYNSFFGFRSGTSNTSGQNNTFIGNQAGYTNTTSNANVYVGTNAGYNSTGASNVFIGYRAGYNELGSTKLYIDNSDTGSPLIYGDFSSNIIRINGDLGIGKSPSTAVDVSGTVTATAFAGSGASLTALNASNLASGTVSSSRVQYGTYFITTAGTNGQVWKSDGSGAGAWGTDNNSGGTVTSVATGTGLTGGPITGSGTISANTSYLQRRVNTSCSAGSSIRTINSDGSVVCETDDEGSGDGYSLDAADGDPVDALYIDNDGYTGFGMNNPSRILDIYDAGDNARIAFHTDLTGAGIGNGSLIGPLQSGRFYLWNYENQDFWFGTNNLTRMIIKGNGYIGMGVSPAYPLHMASGARVTTGGVWTDASSRDYKENIQTLTSNEAISTLKELNPVKFNYKADKEERHVGFIAEDVPELVATSDRKGLSPMDIVAVLTKVVKEQQKINEEHQKVISELKEQNKTISKEVKELKRELKIKGSMAMAETD